MSNREQWNITNISTQDITIGDLSKLPSIAVGKTIDLLTYHTKNEVEQSIALKFLLQSNLLSLVTIQDSSSSTFTSSNAVDGVTVAEVESVSEAVTSVQTVSNASAITFNIDNGTSVITSGFKGFLSIPFNCTINSVSIVADQSGTIAVEIWKSASPTPPSSSSDKINSSTPPTLSTQQYNIDTTLSGWTTTITANDIIGFNVLSSPAIASVTKVNVTISITKV